MIDKPWSFQVELVEGCNRLCAFCGLNAIRTQPGGPYKYLDDATAIRVAREIAVLNPLARLEFAMHGEPLQHPRAADILGMFRILLPKAQIQVTTNGKVLQRKMQERLMRLFSVGVDFVIMDTYEPERADLRTEARTLRDIIVLDFYTDCAPRGWSPWSNHHRKVRNTLILMDDLGVRDGEVGSRVILNHAGNNPLKVVPPAPLKKTCTLPFREMSITWNGNVNICCMDWRHEYTCGNVNERTLESIWRGAEFESARARLQNKDRAFDPCSVCDAGSGARAGLLPKYAAPTNEQIATTVRVNQHSPGARMVRRRLPVVET